MEKGTMAKTKHIVVEPSTKERLTKHIEKKENWKTPDAFISFLLDLYERQIRENFFWVDYFFKQLKHHYPNYQDSEMLGLLNAIAIRYFRLPYTDDKEDFCERLMEVFHTFQPLITEEYKCLVEKVKRTEVEAPPTHQNPE